MTLKHYLVVTMFLFLIQIFGAKLSSEAAHSSRILNQVTMNYQDLADNAYSKQSEMIITPLLESDSPVNENQSSTQNENQNSTQIDHQTATSAPKISSSNPVAPLDQNGQLESLKTSNKTTLKLWAFWFLFGFIPLFSVATGVFYFFHHKSTK